jgi:DNA polymerase I
LIKRLLFDTESDGFVSNATKIHCVAIIDVDTLERWSYGPDQLQAAFDKLQEAEVLIGHNIQRHDIPLMEKLYGYQRRAGLLIRDTMIIARLKYPNVKDTDGDLVRGGKMPPGKGYQGKHTLGAWGYRLGEHKGDYAQVREAEALALGITDPAAILVYIWSTYNVAMHDYMVQDCETNLKLWNHLDPDNYSLAAIELEHRIAIVCDAMEQAGVPFDIKKAGALHAELITEKAVVEDRLKEQFGFWYAPESPNLTKSIHTPKVNNKRYGYVKDCPYTKLKIVEFNPGSRDHIAKVLKDRGWKPTKFTDGGKAQFDEEVLQSVVTLYPEMAGVDRYLMLDKRLSQLADGKQAWLTAVKDDGRIHGVINPMGTTTSRASHFLPNLGQVPNMASPYGPECRELFYAPKGWKFLGADMSGLELRGLGHYLVPLDGGKYMGIVTNGDPHWLHAQVMGLAEGLRDKHNELHTIVREDGSKRFIYAYIYGCWDEKAGQIIFDCLVKARREGGPEGQALFDKFFTNARGEQRSLQQVGKKVRDAFLTRIDGFGQLKEKLSYQVEKFKWVYGLDDRRIPTRSEHSALNFLIQSCGAILCKRWVCDVYEDLCSKYKWGWDGDFVMVLWVHDEIQIICREGLETEIGDIVVAHARKSGEPYGFRGPLDSTAKVGQTWRDTH